MISEIRHFMDGCSACVWGLIPAIDDALLPWERHDPFMGGSASPFFEGPRDADF